VNPAPRAAWELPAREALPGLRAALATHGAAVLSAPPGTGKTTLVPLALAGLGPEAASGATGPGGPGPDGPGPRVLVAEPRRLAARAAARRMAWLLGERPGERVGYTVRGDRRASARTRVEVVTTGVLLQRLQRDPDPGADVVLLDECHERHLDADTALAFLLDVRAALLPELRLVAASATADTGPWSAMLGGAPVVEAHGTAHPVRTVWAPPPRPVPPPHGMRVDPALLAHTAAVVRRGLAEYPGDLLCFLPGAGEIARVAGLLAGLDGLGGDVEVLQLHGRAPQEVQDAVLAPGARRRVVLATAVAESSLTVPGVRIVVDAGLAREPRTDHARGLSALTTVRVSRAGAEQRAGRAGREAPGVVLRCWSEAEHERLTPRPAPEIALADLTGFALQTACWGDPDAAGLALLDPPGAGAMSAARAVLGALGAVDGRGRATARGRLLARVGAHPRLARALLDGAAALGARRAAEIVALLSEEAPAALGDDLAAAWRAVRRERDTPYARRWRAEADRLAAAAASEEGSGGLSDRAAAGLVAALAFPERVARARGAGSASYLMASGTAVELAEGSALRGEPWLAVASADRPVGRATGRIRLAAALDEATALRAAGHLLEEREEVTWRQVERQGDRVGDVVAQRIRRLGAIELSARPLTDPPPDAVRAALLAGLAEEGVDAVLRWGESAVSLRRRLAFLHRALGAPWPDVSGAALVAAAGEWLEPELSVARRRADLERVPTAEALRRLLPWASGEAGRLDELAPERIQVPSGSRYRVDYRDPERPVLAVKLQELFGWDAAPALAGGRVPLTVHLLSPAGRPAAITGDLAGFWREGYRAVRADLRGRYPRHAWPENPSSP